MLTENFCHFLKEEEEVREGPFKGKERNLQMILLCEREGRGPREEEENRKFKGRSPEISPISSSSSSAKIETRKDNCCPPSPSSPPDRKNSIKIRREEGREVGFIPAGAEKKS